jgi:hypothetical protein
MKRTWFPALALVLAAAVLSGCAGTDVVLKYAPGSLDAVTKADPALLGGGGTDASFTLTADGITRLRVSQDFRTSGQEDILLETPVQPFLDAGLDPSALGAGYEVRGVTLVLVGDYGDGTGTTASFREALFQAVAADRTNLTYHQALDHYGVQLPRGKFEWAKDLSKNDKDVVFVLAAQPLADAGVDVENVAGWAFMTVQEPDGSDVDILAKPYEVK